MHQKVHKMCRHRCPLERRGAVVRLRQHRAQWHRCLGRWALVRARRGLVLQRRASRLPMRVSRCGVAPHAMMCPERWPRCSPSHDIASPQPRIYQVRCQVSSDGALGIRGRNPRSAVCTSCASPRLTPSIPRRVLPRRRRHSRRGGWRGRSIASSRYSGQIVFSRLGCRASCCARTAVRGARRWPASVVCHMAEGVCRLCSSVGNRICSGRQGGTWRG